MSRAALHSFRVLVKGHALSSVQSAIYRELNGSRHSDSMTSEYCSGAAHHQRVGLTDYCMCGTKQVFKEQHNQRVTAGMISTTVGAVLTKDSTRWYIRRRVYNKWLHWRELHLLTVQQMAADAVAAQPLSTQATHGAATGGAELGNASAESAAAPAAPAQSATTELVQTATDQLAAPPPASAAIKQPAVQQQRSNEQLIAAHAALHRAWIQHWSTISEREEGPHSQSWTGDSWGQELHRQQHGSRASVYSCSELQASKERVWEAAMAECRAALLQLQEVERTTASTQPTPERAIELHHPAAAIEFEFQANGIAGADGITQIKGFVEAAQAERDRRARQCGNGGNAAVRSWCDRASQLAAMAQQFELAATESVGTLEEILSFQSWDHRLVDRQYGIYLRELETASTTEDLRWQQMKEVKMKHDK